MAMDLKMPTRPEGDAPREPTVRPATGCPAYDRIGFAAPPRALARRVPGSEAWLVRHFGVPGVGDSLVQVPPLESHLLQISLSGGCRLEARTGETLHRATIRHGDLSFIPAGTACRMLPPRDAAAGILTIPAADLSGPLADCGGEPGPARFGVALPRVASLLAALDRDLQHPGPGSRLLYDALLVTLASELAQGCAPAPERIAITPIRLKRVTDFIMANLDRDIGLADMARVASLSPFHFARVFRVATGLSPYRYLLERRMALACDLLADPSVPIVEIAHRCGYAGQAHFTTAFQQRIGLPPGRYRRSMLD